jgi:hypothetical protein
MGFTLANVSGARCGSDQADTQRESCEGSTCSFLDIKIATEPDGHVTVITNMKADEKGRIVLLIAAKNAMNTNSWISTTTGWSRRRNPAKPLRPQP